MGSRGCFGHIATHNPAQQICQQCDQFAACSQSVSDRVQLIRSLNISVEMGKHLPHLTSALIEPEKILAPIVSRMVVTKIVGGNTMSIKAKQVYDGLLKRNVDLKAGIMGHFNPLSNKPKFLSFAFDRLLEGGYKKPRLANLFMSEFGWRKGTASSHVGICTSLFYGLNLIEIDGHSAKTIGL